MGFFKARYVRDYMAARKIKSVFVWAAEIAAVVIAAVVITVGFGKTTVMQEGSMDPTLAAGDVVLINRAAYKIGEPKRGDIIAYRVSEEENASTHIKRIIGLPGETISIQDGQILIDGETYQEKKNFPAIQNPGLAETEITLDKDEYFVLGDNRNNSEDSRFAGVGNIRRENIIGKLWFVASPWDKFGLLRS
ncbi:MAG: signal peptidase I [Lachnospiraceae bacterium]